MEKNSYVDIQISINSWLEQIKSVPSITTSNSEELKNHLLDSMDKLKDDGLDDEEAFWIATRRMGDISILKNEFDEVNSSVIQMRKIILIFSGILVFFMLFSFMNLTTRILFIELFQIKTKPSDIVRIVLSYLTGYHLFFILSTILFYSQGIGIIKKIERFNIKSWHPFLLFVYIILITSINLWLNNVIKETFSFDWISRTHYVAIFDYSHYTFPLTISICFIILYKRYYSTFISEVITDFTNSESSGDDEVAMVNYTKKLSNAENIGNQLNYQYCQLKNIGLDDKEIIDVLIMRQGTNIPGKDVYKYSKASNSTTTTFLIVTSGVLVYFFFYFLLNSLIRILATILQYFENETELNIRRIWTFVIAYHLILLFFSTSVYLLDINIIQRVKRIKIKPVPALMLLLTTVVLAIVDRCFVPISRNAVGQELVLKYKFENIFIISQYCLPFVIGICFLILFNKYYNNNIRIM